MGDVRFTPKAGHAQGRHQCLQRANSGHKPLHRLLSSELALRGSAFGFGPGLPVRIVSECDREAQERGQHQPQIEHIDCAHAGTSSEARVLGAGASASFDQGQT